MSEDTAPGTDDVAGSEFEWVWKDPSHLEAHRHEFYVSPDEILELLRPLVAPPAESGASLHKHYALDRIVGESGLRRVAPDGSDSFWAYRLGRQIPSHLCLGERVATNHVCLWGTWHGRTFVIHTLYPGTRAPREIHDPELALADISTSIEFWRTHAIVVTERDYSTLPNRV
ncbi:MAG: hypothetical protein ACLFP4_15970 [Spirochaetales bacterium]